jgi:hypothetical protein
VTAKTIKRILYGMMAIAFLVVAGRELMLVGASLKTVAAAGAGLILGFAAATGAG